MRQALAGAGGYIALTLLPLAFGSLADYYAEILTVVAVFAILAVSIDLVVGLAGQITLGHAAFFAVGAYGSAILTTRYGWPHLAAAAAAAAAASLVAYVVGRAVLHLRGYYLAMATLGLTGVVYTLLIGLRELAGGAAGMGGIPHLRIFGFVLDDPLHYYAVVLAVAVLVVCVCRRIARSAYGRALIAIHGDEETATALGIRVAQYKINVFVFAAALASIAGTLFAHHLRFIAPDDFTIGQSIHILVMAFLGGIGTVFGPVLGAVVLQLLPEFSHHFKDYQTLSTGLVLMLVLAFFPGGLYGLLRMLLARIPRAGRAGAPAAAD